jgi:branched-chain amino acid transport system substrate-binding protein
VLAVGVELDGVRKAFEAGITVAGAKYPVEILVKDSQSDPNRAAEVAADLILKDTIDLMVVASTPETTNPVSDQCEVNGVPCISSVAPWQPWYFRNPEVGETGYKWTYHFFWGLEDIIAVFLNLWNSLDTNKVVGGMWPNDGDGLAWSSPEVGFPPALEKAGYTVVDPGRYENLKDDFSAEISQFKDQNVEIVTGVMIPPDLGTFLTQASQQGFNPKMFTVGKAALFPAVIEGISGGLGEGLTTEIWWSPSHPFTSSLTDQTAAELAEAYEEASGKQWTQPIGFAHALFEVAIDALSRVEDIEDPAQIAAAIKATDAETPTIRLRLRLAKEPETLSGIIAISTFQFRPKEGRSPRPPGVGIPLSPNSGTPAEPDWPGVGGSVPAELRCPKDPLPAVPGGAGPRGTVRKERMDTKTGPSGLSCC